MSTILRLFKSFLSLLFMMFKSVFYHVISSFFMGIIMFLVAILMYATFYQAYMPVVSHVKPVYLQFSSECQSSSNALCSYPEASVFFTTSNKVNDERMLMRGQKYKVFLDIEMPPSPTNKKLGMFMVNVKFLSSKGKVVRSSSRSCMLHYESRLVRLFRTVFFSLPLTLGITEEKQKVKVNFFDDYIDDSYNPAVQAKIVIMTKQIEIYSSSLQVQASFTGLRYVIFNWPVLFACVAVLCNFITLTLVYSACVNQFASTIATARSNSQQQQLLNGQQQISVSAHQNGTLPNSTPAVTPTSPVITRNSVDTTSNATNSVDATSLSNATNSVDTTTLSNATNSVDTTTSPLNLRNSIDTISPSTPRRSTCRARNSKGNSKSSIRIKFENKQVKLQNFITRNERNLDGQHRSTSKRLPLETTENFGEGSSSLLQENIEILTNVNESLHSDDTERDKKHENSKNCKKEVKGKNLSKRTSSDSKRDKTKQSTKLKHVNNVLSSVSDTASAWDGINFEKKWETFELPRIRRLGMNLQENMLSFTRRLRHCTSDLELTSAEESRLIQPNCMRRSASTSDLTVFSTTVN